MIHPMHEYSAAVELNRLLDNPLIWSEVPDGDYGIPYNLYTCRFCEAEGESENKVEHKEHCLYVLMRSRRLNGGTP